MQNANREFHECNFDCKKQSNDYDIFLDFFSKFMLTLETMTAGESLWLIFSVVVDVVHI